MSGATPRGSPVFSSFDVTNRKFAILMPARSTPVGASSAFAAAESSNVIAVPVWLMKRDGGDPRRACSGMLRETIDYCSILIPDSLITRVHFATSDFAKAPNSSGVIGAGSLPVTSMRSRISGRRRILVTSA